MAGLGIAAAALVALTIFQGIFAQFFFWIARIFAFVDLPLYGINTLLFPVNPLIKPLFLSIPVILLVVVILKFVRSK